MKYFSLSIFIVFLLLVSSCGTLDNSDIPSDAAEKPLADQLKIEEIFFPDAALKSCIEAHDKTYAFEIQNLACSNQGISDLSGLENFRKITHLWLDRNMISDIEPIGKLKEISVLNLGSNAITNIDALINLEGLAVLDLRYNQVQDPNVLQASIELTQLSLHGNRFNDISFISQLVKLRVLDISLNSVSDLWPLEPLPNLEDLYLWNCNLVTADLEAIARLSSLRFLMMTDNSIDDVTQLKELTNLEGLQLENNNIKYGVDQLSNLVKIKGKSPYQINLKGNLDVSCDQLALLENELRSVNQEVAVDAKFVLSDCQ